MYIALVYLRANYVSHMVVVGPVLFDHCYIIVIRTNDDTVMFPKC